MSGTSLGWLPKGDQLTGENIISGDILIGIPSSGIHSNGFSLVRKIRSVNADLEMPPHLMLKVNTEKLKDSIQIRITLGKYFLTLLEFMLIQ